MAASAAALMPSPGASPGWRWSQVSRVVSCTGTVSIPAREVTVAGPASVRQDQPGSAVVSTTASPVCGVTHWAVTLDLPNRTVGA